MNHSGNARDPQNGSTCTQSQARLSITAQSNICTALLAYPGQDLAKRKTMASLKGAIIRVGGQAASR